MAEPRHGYPSIADRHIYPSSVPLGLHSTPARVCNDGMEPLVITIVVPDEAVPGMKLVYAAPDGQELSLTVPPNVGPGSLMTLTQDPATRVWRCVAEEALDGGLVASGAPSAAPEPRREEQEPQPLMFTIRVPEGAYPGMKLHHVAPDGQDLRLTVPDNVPPGSQMILTLDHATRRWKCIAEPADSAPQAQAAQPPLAGPAAAHAPQPAGQAPTMSTFVRQDAARQMSVNLSYVPPVAAAEPWQAPCAPAGLSAPVAASYGPPPGAAGYGPPPGAAGYGPPPVAASCAPPPMAAGHAPQDDRSYAPPPLVASASQPNFGPGMPPPQQVVQQHPSYTPPAVASYVPPPQQVPSYVPAVAVSAPGSCMQPAVVLSYVPPPVVAAEPGVSYVPLPEVLPCGPPPMQVRRDAHNTPRFAPVAHPVMAVPAQSQSHGVSCKMADGSSMNLPPIGMNLPPLFRPNMCTLPPLRAAFPGSAPTRDLGLSMEVPPPACMNPLQPPPMPRMPGHMELAPPDFGPVMAL